MESVNLDGVNSFKTYFTEININGQASLEIAEQERIEFIKDFPLERIKKLTPDEYCLGTQNFKNSLSYLAEFGKYKRTGFGIGGGSAQKHGVFFSKKDNCYRRGSENIEDINIVWPKFTDEFYRFIVNSGESEYPLILDDFPILQGMAMVMTKYLSIYYPRKYLTIGSWNVLRSLMDYFHYEYDDDMRCHQLNFYLNKNLRKDIPEINEYTDSFLGRILWGFYNKVVNPEDPSEVGPGLGDEDVEETHYWMYAPGHNASKWGEYSKNGIMGIGWGGLEDLSQYKSRNEMQSKMKSVYDPNKSYKMDSLATWQFVHDVKPGDIIYAKKGMYKLVGRGIVSSDYYYEDGDDDYKNFRKINWTHIGEWDHPGKAVMKTLTDITAYTDYVDKLKKLFIEEDDTETNEEVEKTWPEYSKEQFLEEVYMDEEDYETLVGLIQNKKNVILQGAPGVGKTFSANRLAYSIMGEKNKDRVMMVQFHQSYSYEDFIEGFRPSSDSNGFEIKKGSFYNFCKKAADDLDNKYFFIIDEINRGNLSKIFGELFMLIEKDKRGNALQLLYSDEKFFVPRNVYIIGMMNTADRSLAMLDYALRRRFSFYEMKPAFKQSKFIEYKMNLNSTKFSNLIDCVEKLNGAISEDSSLGEGFCIGHSYFCDLNDASSIALNNIVEYELIPLLKEYWFDDSSKVRDWSERLRSSIK